MKKQKTRMGVALALAVMGVSGCAEPVGEQAAGGVSQDETVGEAEQAINNGILDSTNKFPYVARISVTANSITHLCSGTLITPRWVLTAAHCFFDTATRTADVQVRFGLDATVEPPPHQYMHTAAKSGIVIVRAGGLWDGGLDYFDNSIIEKDMALIRLDKRVPASVARPLHPEFSDACGDDFEGSLVGYSGEATLIGDPIDINCGEGFQGKRNYQTSSSWEREVGSVSNYFWNTWYVPLGLECAEYYGLVHGDSGGPLIKNGKLCGINSAFTWYPYAPGLGYWENKLAAFDTNNAKSWLEDSGVPAGLPIAPGGLGPIDAKGNWDGECDAYNACVDTGGGATCEKDTDGDGVIDLCDNCQNVYNPEQQVGDDDPDVDGVGEACDFCPSVASKAQLSNQNYEAELAVAYPGKVKPELPITVDTPSRVEALATYKSAFTPDRCDSVPSPVQHYIQSGELAGLPAIVPCTLANPTACNCPLGRICEWGVSNKMRVSPYIHASLPHTANDSTKVGFRYCNCPDGYDIAERVSCQASKDCPIADANSYFDSNSDWKPIVHEGTGGPGTQTSPGTEFSISLIDSLLEQNIPFSKNWIFDVPGMPVQQTFDINGYLKSKQVEGVLWAATRQLNGSLSNAVRDFSHTYMYASPGAVLNSEPPSMPLLENSSWKYFCRDCPLGVVDIFAQIGNPGLHRMTKYGLQPQPGAVSTELRTLFSDIANGDKIFVPAAESMASRANANSSVRLGLVMSIIDLGNFTLGLVESRLESSAGKTVPTVVPAVTSFADINGTEGLSYLAMTDQLFAMGGDVGAVAAVIPKNSVNVFSQASGNTVTFDIDPGKMTYVLASTYRVEDNSFYIVDRDLQNVVTIKRWTPGDQPVTLLATSSEILNYNKFYLVASDDGVGFVLVATDNSVDGNSYVYHLGVSSSGDVTVLGYAQLMEEVIAEPAFVPGGLMLSLRNPNHVLRMGVWDLTTPSMMRSAQSSEPTEKPAFLAAPDLFSVE